MMEPRALRLQGAEEGLRAQKPTALPVPFFPATGPALTANPSAMMFDGLGALARRNRA